jgi:hypothetical protein
VPDGAYRISLVATNPLGKQAQALVPVSVDRSVGTFALSSAAFSPNGDGRLDSVVFGFRLFAPAHVQLQVLAGKTPVATVLDQDLVPGPRRIHWNGAGLPDGQYSVQLDATDALMTVPQQAKLTIDRKAPVLRLVSFRSLRFWLSEPAHVTLTLGRRTLHLKLRKRGYFRVGARAVRPLRAFAVDAAGNRSPTVTR